MLLKRETSLNNRSMVAAYFISHVTVASWEKEHGQIFSLKRSTIGLYYEEIYKGQERSIITPLQSIILEQFLSNSKC